MHRLPALLLLLLLPAMAANGQSLPPPERPGSAWDTQILVNEAHNLTPEALPDVRRRAQAGDARSQVLLGLAYEMGAAGLTANPPEALSWFLKAAAQGIAWAEVWSADFYFTGSTGVPRDIFKALELYKSAANRGDPRAAFFVGQMYFFGEGVPVNHKEAAGWFRRAIPADPDLVPGMVALAESPCDARFCTTMRTIVGAMLTGSAERFAGEWDATAREWEAELELPDSDRCGFTSSDRTADGDVNDYFCDSEPIADDDRGKTLQRELAAAVQRALPAVYQRRDDLAHANPATFFSREGYPTVRVSFNTTPGAATRRVTVLIGQ